MQIRASGPSYAIGVWRNVVLVAFEATPSEPAAAQMASISAEVARESSDGLAMLHMVDAAGGPPPGAPARKHYMSMIRGLNDDFRAAAIIAAGSGFVPSIVRSVVAGFTIAARPRFPLKTFATTDDGAAWLAAQLSIDEAALRSAFSKTRDAIPQSQ